MVCRRTGEWLERTDVLLRLSVAGCAGMLGGATNGIVEILLYYFGVNTLLNCTLYPIPYHPGWLCTYLSRRVRGLCVATARTWR